jgi:hypothetical protein
MQSERIRVKVLARLGVRSETAFIPLSTGGLGAIDAAFAHLQVAGIKGDYLEFGVFRGYSLHHAQQSASRSGLTSMRFFGFDSFEGLPDVIGNDRKAAVFVSGDYRCTLDEVERNLTDHGFDWERAVLVKGFFDQSLTNELKHIHSMKRAAVVMVDCDLYQSTVPVLKFLSGLLQDGTVLLFDDWRCFPREDQGEPRAFREFLAAHPEWEAEPFGEFPPYGQSFVMRRRADG